MRARRKERVHDVDVGRAERDAHPSLLAARDALCQAGGRHTLSGAGGRGSTSGAGLRRSSAS